MFVQNTLSCDFQFHLLVRKVTLRKLPEPSHLSPTLLLSEENMPYCHITIIGPLSALVLRVLSLALSQYLEPQYLQYES